MYRPASSGVEITKFSKFSPPENPIYRVEYVHSTAILNNERSWNELILNTKQFSVVVELLPLNSEDKKMISEFDEYKKKNPDEVKGDWLDKLQHSNFDKLKLNDYLNKMRFEGNIHLKLFKHIERRMFERGEYAKKLYFENKLCESYRCHHYLFTKLERIA